MTVYELRLLLRDYPDPMDVAISKEQLDAALKAFEDEEGSGLKWLRPNCRRCRGLGWLGFMGTSARRTCDRCNGSGADPRPYEPWPEPKVYSHSDSKASD